jgi:hypothetical protein
MIADYEFHGEVKLEKENDNWPRAVKARTRAGYRARQA